MCELWSCYICCFAIIITWSIIHYQSLFIRLKSSVGDARFRDRYRDRVRCMRFYCSIRKGKKIVGRCESGHNNRECNVRARPRATRCDFWMNRRVVMTHRSPRRDPRPINRISELIAGSFEREGTRGGVRFRHGAVTLLYWNSAARVSAFIGSCIPSAINLNSLKSTPRFYIRIDAIPVVIGMYMLYS